MNLKAVYLFIQRNCTIECFSPSLVRSQVILDDVQGWCLLAESLDNDARASANLAWFAFFVDLAQSRPFAQLLAWVNADQWNLVFAAQGGDELLVLWLIAAFGQNAEHSLTSGDGKKETMSLTSVWSAIKSVCRLIRAARGEARDRNQLQVILAEHKGLFWSFSGWHSLVQDLAGLVDSVDETVGDERLLQNFLKRCVEVHWAIESDWRADFTAW